MSGIVIHRARKLGDLCELITKGTTPTTLGFQYVPKGVPFIRATNLGQKFVDYRTDVLYVDSETDQALQRSRIAAGDVLLAIAGTIGRISVVPDGAPAMNCNQAVCIIRPSSEIDRFYLKHWLGSRDAVDQIASSTVTGVISNLSLGQVRSLSIPLPPLAEQRRIAAILDKADALRAKRREAIAKLDQLLQSVFLDMFGDPVKNPKGWPMKPFTDVGAWISGATPSKSEGRFWHGAIPWVSPKDMKRALIDDAEDHVTDTAFKESNLKLVMPGHLLIVVRGMILAHSFPTAVNSVPIAINQDMKAIRPSKDFNVVYLKAAIDALKSRILGVVSTAGHGTRRLDTRDASEVLVPMPPKTEQESFARFVELNRRLFELSQSQKNVEQVLFSSIQHQAFSGLL